MDIFISHSNKDADIAEAMIKIFRSAMNLPSEGIRCTSVNGYRLPIGASTEEQLRIEIHEAKVLIGLITSASLKSHYVLFELGARWGANNFLAPVMAGSVNPSDLPGPLTGRNAINCNDSGQVQQLVDDIAQHLQRKLDGRASFQKYIDELVNLSTAKALNERERELTPNEQNTKPEQTRTTPKLEIETKIQPIFNADELVKYDLRVTLVNKGNTKIDDYRIDVEFPYAFLNQSTMFAREIRGRRTQTHWFFRVTNADHNNHILYPGDSLQFFSIDYHVDDGIARSSAMNETLRITAYAGDEITRQLILPMNKVAKFFDR